MSNKKKINKDNTGNYPYDGDSISKEDLGDSNVKVNDPRIISKKDAVKEDKKSFSRVRKTYDCTETHIIDESYRIDDNPDFSVTALEENPCMEGDPMIPGVGIAHADGKKDTDKTVRKKK